MRAVSSGIIDNVSGRLKNLVFRNGSYKPIQGKDTTICISSYKSPASSKPQQVNFRRAFVLVQLRYAQLQLDPLAFQTWKDEAAYYTTLHGYTINSWMLYSSWYQTLYNGTISNYVYPSDLVVTGDNTWDDRLNNYWT